MSRMTYSEKVMDHFRNPRNVGTFEKPDGVGVVGNPTCGDLMEIQILVKDERIEDIRFKTFGCGSAIATSSMITEMARGMTLDDAMNITRKDVADELDGLPAIKMHCSNLAADALKAAIANYRGEDSGDEEHYHDDECKDGDNGGGGVCTSCVRKSDSEEEKKAE